MTDQNVEIQVHKARLTLTISIPGPRQPSGITEHGVTQIDLGEHDIHVPIVVPESEIEEGFILVERRQLASAMDYIESAESNASSASSSADDANGFASTAEEEAQNAAQDAERASSIINELLNPEQ